MILKYMSQFKITSIIAILVSFSTCNSTSQTKKKQFENDSLITTIIAPLECKEFTRQSIRNNLDIKKDTKQPLIVHIFVPLCDNKNQGIVSVHKSLGDGMNLGTNLYWGAGYGIKTHFKRKKNWKLVFAQKDIDSNILERVIFVREYNPQIKVILIADAYRGDRMESCMRDYFNSLAGLKNDSINVPGYSYNIAKNRDLLIFNGHNGLMDGDIEWIDNEGFISKDAAVISCMSADWFMERLRCLKAYPLITTQDYLPPEAYIVEGIIDAWALGKSKEAIRLNAGNAMFKVFKRNQKAMQRIFKTGW